MRGCGSLVAGSGQSTPWLARGCVPAADEKGSTHVAGKGSPRRATWLAKFWRT
jgi:hypothetical protein